MKNINSIKVGDKVRIKGDCIQYRQVYNGKIGTVTEVHLAKRDSNGYVSIIVDNHCNPFSRSGCFYFHGYDFDIIADADSTSEIPLYLSKISPNLIKYQSELLGIREESSCFTIEYITNFKGEEKMRSEKIINLWRDNQRYAILEIINEKEDEILNLDPLYASVKKHIDEINKLLSENGFSKISDTTKYVTFRSYTSLSATTQLKQNEENKAKLQKDLDKQYNEICAMLSACDTYEQEMEVLKAYKIVGEDGKLVVVNNKMQCVSVELY